MLKKKSTFSQVILIILIAVLCMVATVTVALLAGSADVDLINWKDLNLSNMLPVLLIGGFLTCVIVGIAVLCVSRTVFFKVKDQLKEFMNDGGEQK